MSPVRLHTCGPTCPPDCDEAPDPARYVRKGRRSFTVDMHCHALVPAVESLVVDCPERQAECVAHSTAMGEASAEHNRLHMLPDAAPRLLDTTLRLREMDAMGVDVQLVSPSPSQYYYWAGRDLAAEIVRLQNEGIAGLCADHPERLIGLGGVALQHPDLCVEQLEHCVTRLGLRGVEISTRVNGLELSDPSLAPFWARAEALGCVVFLHPFGAGMGARLSRHYLSNLIGQPLETTIALSHLIFGGVLDRHPGVRILAAHGGGYLPTYCGRSDHGRRVRPETAGAARMPSEYLRRIWFDSLVYSPHALSWLIEQVGIEQVVVGTDYPFDMGSYDIHALVEAVPGLSEVDRARLLGGNAAGLLGLTLTHPA